VSDELLARLAPDIAARARALDQDGHEQEEIRAEIRARIVECAASYRRFDDRGEPVFDYLEQHPSYIVQHAAIPSYSRLRRERREGFATIRIDEEREDEEGGGRPLEIADKQTVDPLERLVVSELADAIASRLDETSYRVFALLVEGLDRAEIAYRLGSDRRRIHEQIEKIRIAATAALLERDAGRSTVGQRRVDGSTSQRTGSPLRAVVRKASTTAAVMPSVGSVPLRTRRRSGRAVVGQAARPSASSRRPLRLAA
jgi:hypothetical protein